MNKPFQRIGSKSNAQVGREFEVAAKQFFGSQNLELQPNFKIDVGVSMFTKAHAFDLGFETKKILVECKSHRWTSGANVPSAKLTVWNEAMLYFVAAPLEYRKIMFVLRDYCPKRKETLAGYYLRTYSHLIPSAVEFWEYDDSKRIAMHIASKVGVSNT